MGINWLKVELATRRRKSRKKPLEHLNSIFDIPTSAFTRSPLNP
jgi:hypothetical protein